MGCCGFLEACGANVVATAVVEYVLMPLARPFLYIFCFGTIEEELQKQQKELASQQEQVDIKVQQAKLQIATQETPEFITEWFTDAETAQKGVKSLMDRKDENKRCCCNWGPHWCWRYRLSKGMEKKTRELVNLVERPSKFEVFGRPAKVIPLQFEPPKDLVAFKSSNDAINKIMDALKEDRVIVGVWGTGGVGKTTLVKQVGYKFIESAQPIMVVVSQTPDMDQIRNKIAEAIHLEFTKKIKEEKANELCTRLKDGKFLIVLDDLWDEWDDRHLKEIGIPLAEKGRGCKIILTTRYKRVCDSMGCRPAVPVDFLGPDDAWKLFKTKAKLDEIRDSQGIITEARKIAEACKGLPVAIVTLGSALKRFKTPKQWQKEREKLQRRLREIGNNATVRKEENAYVCIEMSYSHLRKEAQTCFLLSSLYPEDRSINVEELVQYAWGLKLYKEDSVDDMRDEVLKTIDDLQDSCLLLKDTQGHVKLHDIVRDAALWIASKEGSSFTINSPSESRNERLESCTAISLFDSEENGKGFPVTLACTNLEILLLKNYDVRGVCFQGMKELKVLSLTRSSNLPLTFYPFTSLGKLRVLRLENFDDLSFLGNLWSLEILKLRNSTPRGLGHELVKLENLRILDIARCGEINLRNVFSRLSKLEELFLRDIFIVDFGILENINSLTRLKALYLWAYFPKGFVFQPKLEWFVIDIWTHSPLTFGIRNPKTLSDEGRSLEILGVDDFNPVSVLFEKLESLKVSSINGEYVTCLSDKTAPESVSVSSILQHIKDVRISSCPNLKSVFQLGDVEEDSEPPLLSNLKSLHLQRIYKLRHIWELPIQHVRFQSLVVLSITSCEGLESVFSVSLARSLAVLETLEIILCGSLKQIVTEDDEGEISLTTDSLCFPKLATLDIGMCKSLEYIFPKSMTPQGLPQLGKLSLSHCPQLKHVIKPAGTEGGWVEVVPQQLQVSVRHCPLLTDSFQHHKSLVKEEVGSSTSSSSSKHPTEFHNLVPEAYEDGANGLTSLDLSALPNLECLVDTTTTGNGPTSPAFSNLEILEIKDMDGLERLCKGSAHSFTLQSLKVVKIYECSKLESLLSPSLIRSLGMLEEVKISCCARLKTLFSEPENDVDGESKSCLPQLKTLTIEACLQLEHVLPIALAKGGLPSLASISVARCFKLNRFFGMEKEQNGVEQDGILLLDGLKDVSLAELTNLTRFVPENYIVKAPALESFTVDDCPRLMSFSFEQDNKQLCLRLHTADFRADIDDPNSSGDDPTSLDGSEGLPLYKSEFLECIVDATQQVIGQPPPDLKNLEVTRVHQLQEVFRDEETSQAPPLLSNLEYLKLNSLRKLRWIVKLPTHCFNLQSLKVLEISSCGNLEHLFSVSVVQTLRSLEEVKINNCHELKSVFTELERDGGNGIESNTLCCFRKLKTLEIQSCSRLECVFRPFALPPRLPCLQTVRLINLEKLSGFVAENKFVEAPAVKVLEVSGCPLFPKYFIIQREANNKSISLQELAFSVSEVSDDDDPESYHMLSVVPSEQTSPSFEYACMGNNDQLFQLQGGYLISNIENLRFSNMIWLQHIWTGAIQVATNLRSLTIHSCPSLTYIFPITLIPHLPQLNYLEIANCDNLEQIIIANDDILQLVSSSSQGQLYSQIEFRQLGTMVLQGLPRLVSFLPVGYHLIFRNLESLRVEYCFEMIPPFAVDYSALVVHAKARQGPPLNNYRIDWDWRRPFILPEYVEEAEQISTWN